MDMSLVDAHYALTLQTRTHFSRGRQRCVVRSSTVARLVPNGASDTSETDMAEIMTAMADTMIPTLFSQVYPRVSLYYPERMH